MGNLLQIGKLTGSTFLEGYAMTSFLIRFVCKYFRMLTLGLMRIGLLRSFLTTFLRRILLVV